MSVAPTKLHSRTRVQHVPYPFSYTVFLTSFEVWLSFIANIVLLYLLMFTTSETRLMGPRGLWVNEGKISHSLLLSRDAEEMEEQARPQKVSTDILLTFFGVLTVNSLIQACCRVVMKEKAKFEKEEAEKEKITAMTIEAENERSIIPQEGSCETEVLASAATTTTTYETNKNKKEKCEETSTSTSTTSSTSASPETSLSTTSACNLPQVKMYFSNEVIINVVMAIGVILALMCAVCVQLQVPNEFRGFGAVLMSVVIVGSLVTAGLAKDLVTLLHFCGVVQNVALWVLLFVIGRASLREHEAMPFISNLHFWWN